MRFWITPLSGSVASVKLPVEGADLSRTTQSNRWIPGLAPGTYDVSLKLSLLRKGLEQSISVQRGDALMLELTKVGEAFRFFRPLFLDLREKELGTKPDRRQPDGFRPPENGPKGWHLGVVQNQRIGREGLQMMAAIEKDLGPMAPTDVPLRQARPGWAFFTVANAKGAGPARAAACASPRCPATPRRRGASTSRRGGRGMPSRCCQRLLDGGGHLPGSGSDVASRHALQERREPRPASPSPPPSPNRGRPK